MTTSLFNAFSNQVISILVSTDMQEKIGLLGN
jgi:hypothetical protein